jgi:hypothetical protein
MRMPIITLRTFTLGTPPLPLTIPAMRLSATVSALSTSGLRPRCTWTSIRGAWSQGTRASSADTCHLPRCVGLRVRLARINITGKAMTRCPRHCAPSPRSPATCHSWADSRGVVARSRSVIRGFVFLIAASSLPLLTFSTGNLPGKRKVGGFDPPCIFEEDPCFEAAASCPLVGGERK